VDYLRTYAEEFGLRQIVETLTKFKSVQGAVLGFDDWWLTAWRYAEEGRLAEWENWHRRRRHLYPWPMPDLPLSEWMFGLPSWVPRRRPELSWRPPGWSDYADSKGRHDDMPPVRLTVCLLPGDDEKPEFPETRLPVSFEVRPVARLASTRSAVRPVVGGVSIGNGAQTYGTLGGIVEDDAGQRYGATCAHIFPAAAQADQPARYDDPGASTIGRSRTVATLQACTSATPCGPYSPSPHIRDIDTALIDIDASVTTDLSVLSIGTLSSVIPKNTMTPGQDVEFSGRTSGHRIAEVGGLAVFYRLTLQGQVYCFRDLFEVRWASVARSLFGPVVRDGDSGAWVCAPTATGMGWCGQIIGQDRRIGYAAFAENITTAWSNAGISGLHV